MKVKELIKTLQECDQDFEVVIGKDNLPVFCVGMHLGEKTTNLFTGEYWHNYEYRHLLRSAADYAQYKNLKCCPSHIWWEKKYNDLYRTMLSAGLDPSGYSVEHTKVIDKFLGFKGQLVKEHHNA